MGNKKTEDWGKGKWEWNKIKDSPNKNKWKIKKTKDWGQEKWEGNKTKDWPVKNKWEIKKS